MEIYKIRNKEGLYWSGHGKNRFTKKGKSWDQLNHVTCAITNAKERVKSHDEYSWEIPNYLKESQIVKFELIEKEIINIG